MPSFIFYCTDNTNIGKTIADLRDKTPPDLIDEIIVCDDGGNAKAVLGEDVTILKTDLVGRAKAWNAAAKQAKSDVFIFLRQATKFSKDWLGPLLKMTGGNSITSPIINTLDLSLWSAEPSRWRRFGLRWDLTIHDRRYIGGNQSPVVSSYCIVVRKSRFDELGGFDSGMGCGAGEDIEFSIRNWLCGGEVLVADDSSIAAAIEADSESATNLTRLVESLLPKYATFFYQSRRLDPTNIKTGRLSRAANWPKVGCRLEHDIDWWLQNVQPELLGVYSLMNTAAAKTVAVIGHGPSLDYVKPADIEKHDLLIGVDYIADYFDCDYVLTCAAQTAIDLRNKYHAKQFVLPFIMPYKASRQFVAASELMPGSVQFDQLDLGKQVDSINPPFCNFDLATLTAIHFALFLGPRSVTVFGCDNKFIGERSHTTKVDQYGDGKLWPYTENVNRRFAVYESVLAQFGKLANVAGIPLLRVSHI